MTNLPVTGMFNITCEYGRKGNLWSAGYHTGIDFTSDNLQIYSTCEGEVIKNAWDNSYGNYVVIKPKGRNEYHWFCHMKNKSNVNIGTKVSRTTVLGTMGATGNVTGVHLHFEIRGSSNKYVDNINPTSYLGIPNVVGRYNSNDYQIGDNVDNNVDNSGIKTGDTKILAIKTNIREQPTTSSTPYLYIPNTTIKILESNVANSDGYIWDKVEAVATKRVGYIARTNERYK